MLGTRSYTFLHGLLTAPPPVREKRHGCGEAEPCTPQALRPKSAAHDEESRLRFDTCAQLVTPSTSPVPPPRRGDDEVCSDDEDYAFEEPPVDYQRTPSDSARLASAMIQRQRARQPPRSTRPPPLQDPKPAPPRPKGRPARHAPQQPRHSVLFLREFKKLDREKAVSATATTSVRQPRGPSSPLLQDGFSRNEIPNMVGIRQATAKRRRDDEALGLGQLDMASSLLFSSSPAAPAAEATTCFSRAMSGRRKRTRKWIEEADGEAFAPVFESSRQRKCAAGASGAGDAGQAKAGAETASPEAEAVPGIPLVAGEVETVQTDGNSEGI